MIFILVEFIDVDGPRSKTDGFIDNLDDKSDRTKDDRMEIVG